MTHPSATPYLPFARPEIDEETIAGVADVLRSGWLASGPRVAEFEGALGEYLGGATVRAVSSGTAALEIALRVAGVAPGDEVVTPALSFVATANAILKVGARPIFVDVDLDTRNLDLARIEQAISTRTKALLPVHFAGLAVDLPRLYAIAETHQLRVVEDAAHAIGARSRNARIGSRGDLVAFSFHPNKNMTSIEGGALAIARPDDVRAVERLRFHGIERTPSGDVDLVACGGKFNLSDVAARVGLGQLRRLEEFNARRRALAERYLARLRTDPPMRLPASGEGHAWHLFAPLLPLGDLRCTRRQFIQAMHERGIGVGIHYPALHTLTLYRALGGAEGQCPNAERVGRSTVTLPLFPSMTFDDVDRVCDAARDVIASSQR